MAKSSPSPDLSRRQSARRMRVLIGTWKIEGRFVGGPEPMDERGTVTFRWLEKDALLIMRSRMKVAPRSMSVMGADDTKNAFTMIYSDARRVGRIYAMTLSSRRWTYSRREPGFHQRSIGRISTNKRKIHLSWEKSSDGRRWIKDFDLTYTKQ
jgi:hypothetical protein